MKLLTLALAGALLLCASANDVWAQSPPARFDHSNSQTHIRYLDTAAIAHVCGYPSGHVAGCAINSIGTCTIYILRPNPFGETYAIRHERAHCNGWSERHER